MRWGCKTYCRGGPKPRPPSTRGPRRPPAGGRPGAAPPAGGLPGAPRPPAEHSDSRGVPGSMTSIDPYTVGADSISAREPSGSCLLSAGDQWPPLLLLPQINPFSTQYQYTPSSVTGRQTSVATAFNSADAFPMATALPTACSISISLLPSPNATASALSKP